MPLTSGEAKRQRLALTLIARALERNGLTGFDLLSWTGILELHSMLRGSETGIGLFESHELREVAKEALLRKAELLDAEHPEGKGFHRAVAKSFGAEPCR